MREMKDSGVAWIGVIPKDWSIRQASQVFAATKHPNKGLEENNLLSLSYGRIVRKSIETPFGLLPESFEGYNIIDKDTIVLRLTDLQNDQKSLRVGIVTEKGIITSAYLSLRCITNDTPKYMYYLLHCFDIVKGFYGMGGGIRQGLAWDGVKNLRFYLPNQAEQKRIADFLDAQCAEIDSILEQTQTSIEEYKKLKQSVITEAVTKGIRGERPMKDSGVEWIGEIPREWVIRKIKSQCVLINGDRGINYPGTDDFVDDGIPFITGHNIHGLSIDMSSAVLCKSITKERYSLMGGAKLSINDIVFCLRGGGVGNCAINESLPEGTIASSLMVIRANYLADAHYLNFFLHSSTASIQADFDINGSCAENLAADNVANYLLAVPPFSEQREIAAYLDKKCSAIDSLIASKQALITELESYKKSLIYDYVTGKKEVY